MHQVSCLVQNFLAKHQITQVTQRPFSPGLVTCNFWLFPKLVSPLKGKRFQPLDEFQENRRGQLLGIGSTVCLLWELGVLCACFEGYWGVIILYTMFLVSYSINVSIFHIMGLDTFWTDLVFFSIFCGICTCTCYSFIASGICTVVFWMSLPVNKYRFSLFHLVLVFYFV